MNLKLATYEQAEFPGDTYFLVETARRWTILFSDYCGTLCWPSGNKVKNINYFKGIYELPIRI